MKFLPSCAPIMREKYDEASPKVKQVIDYVMANPDIVVTRNIVSLSEIIGVSQTTVINAAKTVGFNGFADFKLAIARGMQDFPSSSGVEDMPEDTDGTRTDACASVLRFVFEDRARSILDSLALLDPDCLSTIADIIIAADSVKLLGSTYSAYVAQYLCIQLIKLNIHAVCISDPHYQIIRSSSVSERDVLIGFSTTGATESIINAFNVGKRNGCTCIGVTATIGSQITQLADYSVVTATCSCDYHKGHNSIVQQMTFASALIEIIDRKMRRNQ